MRGILSLQHLRTIRATKIGETAVRMGGRNIKEAECSAKGENDGTHLRI